MTFNLTVLGSSSAIPTLQRNPSAHLLNANERLFLIDCAEGTQLQLRRYRIHFQRIHHIFISHLHGDHYFGLIGLLTSFHLLGRRHELHLYGPAQLHEIITLQLEASCTTLLYPLVFHSLPPEGLLFEDEKLAIHCFLLRHSVPTWGFVFREKPRRLHLPSPPAPRSYAYCSDTAFDESVIPHVRGVDLLYHETTFMDDRKKAAAEKYHSTTLEAATIAARAQVKKLLIGHFSARYEDTAPLLTETQAIFPATICAADGMTIEI
jgi:ribonuclease Z